MIVKSDSVEMTQKIAYLLAQAIEPPCCIAMFGDLGAGKTAFTGGLAKGLGFEGNISSPTFAIVNRYEGGRAPLCHYDMYRVDGWEDLYSTGFFDSLDENAVVAVEWSENITAALPQKRIDVNITLDDDGGRIIEINGRGGIAVEDFSDRLR